MIEDSIVSGWSIKYFDTFTDYAIEIISHYISLEH